MARSWLWAPASYNGVPFYVKSGTPSGGRRLAVHEYPGGEAHDVEDMGRSAGRFSVTAYLTGEATDVQVAALLAVLDREGAGLLSLPMFGAKMVRPEKWSPSWTDDKLNAVGLQIDFVEEGAAGAPFVAGLALRILSTAAAGLPGLIGTAVSGLFQAISPNSFAFKDAGDALVDMGASVEALRTGLPVPDDVSRYAAQIVGDTVATLTGTGLPDPGTVAAVLLTQVDDVVEALPEGVGGDVLAQAASYTAALAAAAVERRRLSSEGGAIYCAAAVMFAAETIRVLAATPYEARSDAIAARRRMSETADAVIPLYGALGDTIVSAFNELWGTAADYLSRSIATLAPVVLVEAPKALPSTLLAYRLYGDTTRASELVSRNKVATPLLMPTLFEASSS